MTKYDNIIEVEAINWDTNNGYYIAEYHNAVVFEKLTGSLCFFNKDGSSFYSINSMADINGSLYLNPKEIKEAIQGKDKIAKIKELEELIETKNKSLEYLSTQLKELSAKSTNVQDLREMAQEFSVDEIIRLKKEGVI